MIDRLLGLVKRLCAVAGVGIVLFVAALTYLGGETTTVTARGLPGPTPCDVTIAGQCARQLATTTTVRSTTTTRPPTTTVAPKPVYGPERPCNPGGTDILVIVDGRTHCIIRTPSSAQLAWALTRLGN